MPEERSTAEDRLETRMDRLEHGQQSIRESVAGLKGGFDQMDKRIFGVEQRMANIESLQRWAIGIMITSWLTLVGLTVTVLLKLP